MNRAAAFDTGTTLENGQAASVPQTASSIPQAVAAPQRSGDALFHIVLLVLSAGVLLAAFVLQAGGSTVVIPLINQPLPELCALRRMTGMSCPGCGLTRCFISLAHGDLAAAWAYNPAGIWLFGVFALQIPYRGYQLWRISRGQPELMLLGAGQVALGVLTVALIGQWLVRLIP